MGAVVDYEHARLLQAARLAGRQRRRHRPSALTRGKLTRFDDGSEQDRFIAPGRDDAAFTPSLQSHRRTQR